MMSCYLCLMSSSMKRGDLCYPLLPYRYLLLLMSVFSFYAGLIYNDFSSLSFNLFGSCYLNNEQVLTSIKGNNCVYLFGVDPVWTVSHNELQYTNSLKMKMAIIIGIAEMSLGIILRGINNFKELQFLDFFTEFLPMFIFLYSFFGYMVLLIILKWLHPWQGITSKAPSIIN